MTYGAGKVVYVRRLVQIAREHIAQLVELFDHRRNYEIEYPPDDGNDENQRDDDGQRPCGHVHLVLDKLYDGVEQIGQQPCHEERQQHVAQIVGYEQHGADKQGYEHPAYEFVESDFLFKHILSCQCVLSLFLSSSSALR